MTSVTHIPKNKNLLNKKVCQSCEPGKDLDVCTTKILKGASDEECMDQCKNQNNAESYYYDKDGTQRCYCGNTKAICSQYTHIQTHCSDKSTSTCKLIANQYVNSQFVPNVINNNKTCKEQCKSIMNSSGIYCEENKSCMCIDPSIIPTPDPKPDPTHMNNQCSSDQMRCKDGSTIPTKATKENGLSSNYFSIGNLFGDDEGSNDVKNAFCGCDKSVVDFYNKVFADTSVEKRPTLNSIWVDSVKFSNTSSKDLKSIFTEQLQIVTKGDTDKLRALTAYEMCIITNNQYSRKLDQKCPDPSKNFGGWLDCHLNSKESLSGKWLNRGVKILVMLMLVHVLFRTFIPKQGDIKDSLIFAMFMPPQFLGENNQENNKLKGGILGLSISIMLIIMTITYSAGSSKKVWGIFGGMVAVFSALSAYGFIRNESYAKITGILGLIVSCITLFVVNDEPSNNSNIEDTDFRKLGDNLNSTGFWILICSLIVFLVAGIIGIFKGNKFLKSAFILVPLLIGILIIINLKPKGSNEGEAFIHYFIPNSLKELPKSGLAISIYAVMLGALMTRLIAGGSTGWMIFGIFFGILMFSAIAYIISGLIIPVNDKDTVDDEKAKASYVKAYFGLISVFTAITFISAYIGKRGGSEYFIPYIITTVFGVLPLAMFSIIINFAIANYSPAIELFFLVIYRFSGFIVARNPNNGIGKIILRIFGKRSTDKWVLPFLPFVSNFIELFYLITGDEKPGYFNQSGRITGVSNTNMWLS